MTPALFRPGLYVAATPIGHLADITERVRQGLTLCDQLYAEDTRRARMLLSGLGLHRAAKTIHALHEHNELEMADRVLAHLNDQQSVLLISDAGTPAISDPGARVVDAAWQAGFPVTPLPGPSALTAALSVSGFSRWPTVFWGFGPTKTKSRRQWLERIRQTGGLAVVFEAPHRAKAALEDCAAVFGPATPMLFGRELTKQFETLIRGTIKEVQEAVAQQKDLDAASAKGEMVWVFDLGDPVAIEPTAANDQQLYAWARILADEMPAAQAAKCLSAMLGISRQTAYQAVLKARE